MYFVLFTKVNFQKLQEEISFHSSSWGMHFFYSPNCTKTQIKICTRLHQILQTVWIVLFCNLFTCLNKQTKGGSVGLSEKHPGSGNVPWVNQVTWVLLTYQVLRIFEKCHSLMENKAAKELLGCLHHRTCSILSGSSHHLSVQCREMEFPALQSICKPAPGAGQQQQHKEQKK